MPSDVAGAVHVLRPQYLTQHQYKPCKLNTILTQYYKVAIVRTNCVDLRPKSTLTIRRHVQEIRLCLHYSKRQTPLFHLAVRHRWTGINGPASPLSPTRILFKRKRWHEETSQRKTPHLGRAEHKSPGEWQVKLYCTIN